MNQACNAHTPYCHLWSAPLYYIFPHCLINSAIFEETSSNIKLVFLFSLQILYQNFLIVRRICRDMIKNEYWSSRKVSVILVRFKCISNFPGKFSKNTQISNSIKIRPMGAELFHADRQTDTTKLTAAFRNTETWLKRVHYYYIHY
jgi:hypothetical protein